MTSYPSAAALRNRYKSDSITTMSPGRLLVALYDRLLLDLERAAFAIHENEIADAHVALVHAQEIVTELHDALDVSVWPEGANLAALYEFLHRELVAANLEKDMARIAACHDIISPLRDAWREAAGITA